MKLKYFFLIIFLSFCLNMYFYTQSLEKQISNEQSVRIELEYQLQQSILYDSNKLKNNKSFSIEFNTDSTEILISNNNFNEFFKAEFSSDSSQIHIVIFKAPIINDFGYNAFLKK